jgi:16S rRNA (cytosine967-C5)-methyltransferase
MDVNRKTAFYILRDVDEKKSYSHLVVNDLIARMKPNFPAFVRELSYGVIRQRMYLDYIIGNFVRTPMQKLHVNDRTLLRMGFYQILFMNSVPDYAAVSETINLAKRFARGREGFINGVLRQYLRDRDYVALPKRDEDEVEYFSIKYSYARWIVKKLKEQFGDATEKLLASGNVIPPISIRVNTLKISRDELYRRLLQDGYKASLHSRYSDMLITEGDELISGRLYRAGLYSVQDDAALETVCVLDPMPGETVVDVCAAPGGKTMAIAERMQNHGKVYAFDISKRRLDQISEHAKRLGVDIVEAWTWDATRSDSELLGQADRVLVDAPCSGLGTVRKKPEIKYKEWNRDMELLPVKQGDILAASSAYVRPGGILVYSTCTILRRENEQVVSNFMRKYPIFEKIEERLLLPHTDDTDGFYICKLKKKEMPL